MKFSKQTHRLIFIVFLAACLPMGVVSAEILNNNTPYLRNRIGSGGGVNTVIYEAGIPASLGGLPGVTAQPETISTNNINGGSGVYTVRIVADVNAKGPVAAPLTGIFTYDSSSPLTCTTAATCGTETISFTNIRWNAGDSDTLNSVLQYNGTAAQVFQVQTDTSNVNNQLNTRHRNYYQFVYDNADLLPAGIYEGVVTINGTAN